jgi:hypothetical protein
MKFVDSTQNLWITCHWVQTNMDEERKKGSSKRVQVPSWMAAVLLLEDEQGARAMSHI